MEAKYLVYLGDREKGTLLIRREEPDSPYRRLSYWKDMSLRIGNDIPISVAESVVSENKGLFKIIAENLEPNDAFVEKLGILVKDHLIEMSEEEIRSAIGSFLSDFFGDSVDSKEPDPEPETPRKRVRLAV